MSVRVFPPAGSLTEPEQEPPVASFGLFQRIVLGAPAASITFFSIPQTGTHLQINIQCLDSSAAVDRFPGYLKLNNDNVAGNYANTQAFSAAGAVLTGATLAPLVNFGMPVFRCPGSLGTASPAAVNVIQLPFYSGLLGGGIGFKHVICRATERTAAGNVGAIWELSGIWAPNGAISRIDLLAGSTTFVAGTKADLYIY